MRKYQQVPFVEEGYQLLWFEVSVQGILACYSCNLEIFLLDKMSENIKNATNLIEQGHVRVGAEMIKDPAFLVSRTLEDFVTWVDSSAIRKHVLEYNNVVS